MIRSTAASTNASGSSGSTGRARIDSVDGLRALAFLLVFAFHTWEFSGQPHVPVVSTVISQNTRPDFFVVLTGFVLFLPFARNPGRASTFLPRPYLRRRLRRIVLPYYVALALAIVLPQTLVLLVRMVGRDASWQPFPDAMDVVSHVTFTHMFFPEYWDGINGSLWTMSLEMQLYLLFPLLVLAWYRFGARGLVAALAGSFVYRVVAGLPFADDGFPVDFLVAATAIGRLMEFLAGMVAALLMFRWRDDRPRHLGWVLLATTVGGYLLATLGWPTWIPVRETALGVTFGSVIVAAVTFRPVERGFAWRPVSWLGFRAYSMFLVHQPVAWYVSEFLSKVLHVADGRTKLVLLWTLGLLVVVAFGQVLYLFVERPCIRWAKAVPYTSPSAGSTGGVQRDRTTSTPTTGLGGRTLVRPSQRDEGSLGQQRDT